MGVCGLRLRRRIRYIQARHLSWHAAAREQRELWVRVPHDGEKERLRFHRLRAQVSGEKHMDNQSTAHSSPKCTTIRPSEARLQRWKCYFAPKEIANENC